MKESLNSTSENPTAVDKKKLASKIKGVNAHLEALVQKKLRIDLEIKQTKARLIRYKKKGQSFRTTPLTESFFAERSGSLRQLRFLTEATTEDLETIDLMKSIASADQLLEVVTELEDKLYLFE